MLNHELNGGITVMRLAGLDPGLYKVGVALFLKLSMASDGAVLLFSLVGLESAMVSPYPNPNLTEP